MARKTKIVTITDENRDQGKTFIITEVPADQAESWALRLFLALKQSEVDVPESLQSLGMAGIASMGIRALLSMEYSTLRPLLAEMLDCVKFKPERAELAPVPLGSGINCLVEEVSTLVRLRREVAELHLGFSIPDMK